MEGSAQPTSFLSGRNAYLALALLVAVTGLSVATETYLVAAVPFAILMVAWTFYSLDSLLLFLVAITPLSITLKDSGFNVGLSLPAEPILAGITFFLLLRFLQSGRLPLKALAHPVGIAILLQLGWMGVTILTSEMPLVSFKAWISRIWFIVPLFFAMLQVFEKPRARDWFFPLYAFSLAIASLYTMYIHSQYGFSKETSTWVMYPFYKEHTVYGMALAFVYPFAVYRMLRDQNLLSRFIYIGLWGILTAAIILSYTRAAWLSVIAAGGVYALIRLKISLRLFLGGLVLVLAGLWATQDQWMRIFTKNDTVSSDNFSEHVQSVSNVSTDASNLERINRWMSALRMFEARPHTGWGAGTYQFQYAPFQHSAEMTIISTNEGNMGNAHSEYIGPLAEQGWPGLLFVVVLLWTLFRTGFRVVHALPEGQDRSLALMALLGLVTYFVHGVLNNFLDMDKAAVLVWGSAALLVYLDLSLKEKSPQ